jgi:RNA recognition motif-containing protein
MAVQIYAGNLPYKIKEEELKRLFEAHGEVSSVKIVTDRETGRSKGFGFVEMPNEGEANNAISQLNNAEVMGRNIQVNVARPRAERV